MLNRHHPRDLVMIGAVPAAIRNWDTPTAIDARGRAFRVYTAVVAIEVVAAAVVAAWAGRDGRSDLIAPLILAVVGIHFVALALVFGQPVLHLAGALLVAVAALAALNPWAHPAASFWCGVLGAPVFLVVGAWCTTVGRRTF